MNTPCHHCEKREIGCHAHCEDYLAYRAIMDEARQKRLNEIGLKGMTVEHETRNENFRKRVKTSRFSGR